MYFYESQTLAGLSFQMYLWKSVSEDQPAHPARKTATAAASVIRMHWQLATPSLPLPPDFRRASLRATISAVIPSACACLGCHQMQLKLNFHSPHTLCLCLFTTTLFAMKPSACGSLSNRIT